MVYTWAEESLLKHLHQTPFYSIMADECTDVSTVEELSLFCRWIENGEPTEHFIDFLPMKRTDTESIYSALVECLKSKNIQLSNLIGMGFDGAATFSGKKSGVQARMKNHSPHALFVHCHCYQLQLACVQAANGTAGIEHVYVTLTTLWKFFYYSPKCAQSLKEVQKVLNFPELKIVKSPDTRCLAHERCVRAVKASYSAIITTLDHIYSESHEPEALGIKKALCKKSTIADIYLLDYVLPQVAKLNRALQTENLDLSMICSLLDATLHSIDDAVLSSSNWVLELLEAAQDLETAIEEQITQEDISTFQEKIGQFFIHQLRDNITSHFTSSNVVSSFSIFDPRKVPATSSPLFSLYGEVAIDTLIDHYAQDFPAETVHGVQFVKEGIISLDVRTEWKTYRQLLSKQPKDNLKTQLQELATSDTLIALLPNLHKLACCYLSLPIGTASV